MLRSTAFVVALLSTAVLTAAACGDGDDGSSGSDTGAPTTAAEATSTVPPSESPSESPSTLAESVDEQRFPDVVGVEATADGDAWTFSVTISSPYDTPERYADAWRILGPDGTVYGERPLAHDHQFEQPFTRSLSGVTIPDGVDSVVVEGRDHQYGWGGVTFEYELPSRSPSE